MSYTLVLEWMPGDLYMSAVTARCTAPTSSYSVVWLPPNKVYQITLYCGSTSLVSFLVGAFRGKAWSYMSRTEFYDCARALFGVEPEYPWPDEPGYAVLRHPDNRKWFAVVMDVPRDKLGLSGTDALTVVNLKGDPLLIGMLHSRPGFFPAYHMNKEHWISAALDGSVDAEELRALLAESFTRTAPKKHAPRTKGAAPAKPGGGAG